LEDRLGTFPEAGVGEIGLDRWIEGYDLPRQKEVFSEQLAIAGWVSGPISIHVLRAWGALEECLDDWSNPRPFLLHSYGGSRELVPKLLERGAWFSLSGYFFRPDKAAKLEVFRAVPEDRLLLETDAPDMLPPEGIRLARFQDEEVNHPANLAAVYTAFANWRGMEMTEATLLIDENFEQWAGGKK
jgi:TatD DNase family protein